MVLFFPNQCYKQMKKDVKTLFLDMQNHCPAAVI